MMKTSRRRFLPRIRVLFDATYAHRLDGTGRYTRETLRSLRKDPDLVVLALHAPRVTWLPRPLRVIVNGLLHILFSQIWLPAVAVVRQAHIVHTMAVAPWFCRVPVVVTIHDALDFRPRYRPSWIWSVYVRTLGLIGARRAEAVVTVSRASASEIAHYYRVPLEQIHVIPNAFSLANVIPERPPNLEVAAYVLFVGDTAKRKNLATAIAALERLRTSMPDIDLIVTGTVTRQLADTRPWLHALGGISDSELVWLYRNAAAVIVPSRYEGFSLPVLEALTFGTPVVASDIPAHREIAGNAARFAQPDDPDAFARHLDALLKGDIPPISGGYVSHSWDSAAARIVDLYLELIGVRLGVRR